MKMETVLKCAQMAAAQQESALGYVTDDIQELIAELTAPPPAPAPQPKVASKKATEAPATE